MADEKSSDSFGNPSDSPAVNSTLVGQAVNHGASLLSTLIDNLFQRRTTKENREFSREQASTAYARQLAQWHRQNAYDSPSAQMQRFLEAGLNPNLIYSDMNLGNVVQDVATGGNATAPAVRLTDQGMLANQYQLAQAQIRRLDTQNDNDTRMTDSQITRFAHENNLTDVSVRRAAAEIDLISARTASERQQLENLKVEWATLDEKRQQEHFQTAFIEATQDMRIQGANAEQEAIAKTAVAMAMAQFLNVKADTALKWANVSLAKSNEKVNQSQIRLNNANMAVARNQAQLLIAQLNTENARTEQVLTNLAGQKNYNRTVYGEEGETVFWRCVHYFTSEMDAMFRMAGQLFSFGAFAKP